MPEIAKKTWQDTRPSDCKDTGIGGAADEWKKACVDVKTLTDSKALATAGEKNKALVTAIAAAGKALEPLKKHKKYEATKALLDDWTTKTTAYATSLDHEQKRRMQVELENVKAAKAAKDKLDAKNLAAANAEIDEAFTTTAKYQLLMEANKKAIKEKVLDLQALIPSEADASQMTDQARKALTAKANTLAAEVARISLDTNKIGEGLRKDLTSFRLRGASGIAKDHGVNEKDASALSKRFNDQKALMDKFELDGKTIQMLAHKANVDSTAIETRLEKTWDVMKGYKKTLDQLLYAVAEVTKALANTVIAKSPGAQLKSWTAQKTGLTKNAVLLQIQACQAGMELYKKAEKRLDQMVDSGLGHVPTDDVTPEISALRKKINTEMDKLRAAKAAFDKEAAEGIAHGQGLQAALPE
jgi:hypothetical protein